MIQYLLTPEQLQLLLWTVPDESRFHTHSSELKKLLITQLSQMLDRQAERVVLSSMSEDDAEVLAGLIDQGSSEFVIQDFILRKIPDTAGLASRLLEDFRAFFVPTPSGPCFPPQAEAD